LQIDVAREYFAAILIPSSPGAGIIVMPFLVIFAIVGIIVARNKDGRHQSGSAGVCVKMEGAGS
jgi:hypothetical protein